MAASTNHQEPTMTTTVTVTVPPAFYDDHVSRDLPAGTEVKRTRRSVTVELDAEGLGDLLSDARHYADPGNGYASDPYYRGLVASARATVKRLEAVEAD